MYINYMICKDILLITFLVLLGFMIYQLLYVIYKQILFIHRF